MRPLIPKLIVVAMMLFALAYPSAVMADQDSVSQTMVLTDVHATESDPYIIEGQNISTGENGIVLKNCENVIIRNNYIRDCAYSHDEVPSGIDDPGISIYVERCNNVTIENNVIEYGRMGIRAKDSSNITVRGNEISNIVVHAGILLENCHDSLITDNYVHGNGFEDLFYGPGSRRIIGIYIVGGHDIEVSYNRSCNNTSDGISVVGQNYYLEDQGNVWKGTVNNISVHDNFISDNNEQGIWSCRSRDCLFYDNEIHVSCSETGIGLGIAFEFDVDRAEVYGNTIYSCKVPHGAGANVSHDNYFHDNVLYAYEECEFFLDDSMMEDHDYKDESEKSSLAGIPLSPSSGNIDENNLVIVDGAGDEKPEQPDGTTIIEDIHATIDDPYVIDGLDITNEGDGMVIRNSENIIIRNCSITYCAYTEENIDTDYNMPGMGLFVDGCSNILIEDCIVSYNLMGMKIYKSSGVTISGNTVSNNIYHCAIMLYDCKDCTVTENTVEDNGFPERFYESGGGKRIIGIYIIKGSNIEISFNRSCRNTSDGILVGGQDYSLEGEDESQVWKTLVYDVSVHDNYIADNHEQGIWCARARNCQFYNNEIHVDCSDIGIGTGMSFDLDVVGAEIWGNTIYACKVPSGVEMAVSHDNYIHDNILYTFEDSEFLVEETMMPNYDYSDDIHKAKLAGIEHVPSYGNVSENNIVHVNGQSGDDDEGNPESDGKSIFIFPAIIFITLIILLAVRRRR